MLNNRSKVILGSCGAATLAVTAFVIDGDAVFGDGAEPQDSAPIRHPLPKKVEPRTGPDNWERTAAMSAPIERRSKLRVEAEPQSATMPRSQSPEREAMPRRETIAWSPRPEPIEEPGRREPPDGSQERPLDISTYLDDPPEAILAVELAGQPGPAERLVVIPIADDKPVQLNADLRNAVATPKPRLTPVQLPAAEGIKPVDSEEIALATVAEASGDQSEFDQIVPPDPAPTKQPAPIAGRSASMQHGGIERAALVRADRSERAPPRIAQTKSDQARPAAYRQQYGNSLRAPVRSTTEQAIHEAASVADQTPLAAVYPVERRERTKRPNSRSFDRNRSTSNELTAKAIDAHVSTRAAQGTLPLQVTDGELVSIRLADLISLFENQMDRSLFVWLKTSAEANKFVTPETLRNAGIDVEFNPASNQLVLSVAQ